MSTITSINSGKELVGGGGYALNDASQLIPYGDRLYGPYSSIEDAHDEIISFLAYWGVRKPATKIPMGFTVGIIEGDKVVDYSYQGTRPSDGYTVGDIKPKNNIGQVIADSLNDEGDNEIKSAILDFLKNQNVVVLNQN